MNKKEKLKKLEKDLKILKDMNDSSWDTYGSELCAGDMIKKEEKLEKEIIKLKNEIVKDFFIERGSYPDFEITNSPMFTIEDKGKTKTLMVQTLGINVSYFIDEYLNNLNIKTFIYNNGDIDSFNDNMFSIRFATLECDDRIIKYRKNKINKIYNKS